MNGFSKKIICTEHSNHPLFLMILNLHSLIYALFGNWCFISFVKNSNSSHEFIFSPYGMYYYSNCELIRLYSPKVTNVGCREFITNSSARFSYFGQ